MSSTALVLSVAHWIGAFVVVGVCINLLYAAPGRELIARAVRGPCRLEALLSLVEALAVGLVATGAAGQAMAPFVGHEPPSLQDALLMIGGGAFALAVATRRSAPPLSSRL